MSRFDWRDELDNIARGMDGDLQKQTGQTVNWYVFDSEHTVIDPIYDVGAQTGGRVWRPPIFLPVLGAIKLEGQEVANDRGFYVVDTLRVVFGATAAIKSGLGDIIYNPDDHNIDRMVYENKVFGVNQVRVRGVLTAGYAVVAADCQQVKDEELYNDPQFQSFISTSTPEWANLNPDYEPQSHTDAPDGSVQSRP